MAAVKTNEKDKVQSTTEHSEGGGDTPAEELGVMIDDLLDDLSTKFSSIASELTAKMDDMSRRIDNLEASMQQNSRTKERDE